MPQTYLTLSSKGVQYGKCPILTWCTPYLCDRELFVKFRDDSCLYPPAESDCSKLYFDNFLLDGVLDQLAAVVQV